jgi:CheY-like chemotaxis protein
VEANGLLSLLNIETGAIGLEMLAKLPDADFPHIVIIPFRLPILTGIDFITAIYSHPQLRCIPIFVWGPDIPADEIEKIYDAGAAYVLPGQFDATHLDAVRRLCRGWTSIEIDLPTDKPRSATALLHTSGKATRNTRLGALFAWTGCISTGLWVCSVLQLGTPYIDDNLAPLPVFAALASAGFSLMAGRTGDSAKAQY